MADDESFLARWSRRKRDGEPPAENEAKPIEAPEPAAAETPVDPESLPPIDDIGADSDIRAFLEAGVPPDLTRAALRRAWSTDPAIRDFIGLSENSWDFNAPDGAAGFGSITVDEIRRVLAHVQKGRDAVAPAPQAAEDGPPEQAAAGETRSGPQSPGHDQEQARTDGGADVGGTDLPLCDKENTAVQHDAGESEYSPVLARRGHGGALPE